MAVQTSNIISTQVRAPTLPPEIDTLAKVTRWQIYRNGDKPLYYTGNKILLGIAAYNVCLFIGAKAFYVWKNK